MIIDRIQQLLSYLDLRSEMESPEYIREEIEKGIFFKGTNIWILVFAIVIASVGLNVNSTAVIIGAMLISPLMGPINGMGFSVATYDFVLFKRSAKNFGFAVLASLVASMMYFILTPVSVAQSELLARTSPTIYDVMIALFGGLAGIVAISSKKKGNVIPGVAIATALMPPLCTAGYGLGTGQLNFFFGAIYLFAINTVFIGIASILVSRFFRFPIKGMVDEQSKKKITRWITFTIIITVVPSIYFGYNLVVKERFMENAQRYVKNITFAEGAYLLKHEIEGERRKIDLIYAGTDLDDGAKDRIRIKASDFELEGVEIVVRQGFSLSGADEKANEKEEFLNNNLNSALFQLEATQKSLDSLKQRPMIGKMLFAEAKALDTNIVSCTYAETFLFHDTLSNHSPLSIVTIGVKGDGLNIEEQARLKVWLMARLQIGNLKLFVEKYPK